MYLGISLIMEIFSHYFIKWLIQFSYFTGISLYINKTNDRTSPAADTVRKNPAFSRGLQPIVNINETCVSLLWKPLGAQAKAISFIFLKAFQCASAAIPCLSHKSSSLGTRPGPAEGVGRYLLGTAWLAAGLANWRGAKASQVKNKHNLIHTATSTIASKYFLWQKM